MNDIDMVEGSILGDSSLRKRSNMVNAYFITAKTARSGANHLDRLEQLRDALGLDATISFSPKNNPTSLWLWTKTYPELTELFWRWYPDGRKRVPIDFDFSPKSLASFFMDDGSSSWFPSKANPLRVIVSFYPQGFTLEEIARLNALICKLELNCRLNYGTPSNKPRLTIKENASVYRLMDILEPYLVPSYMYKIKRPHTLGIKEVNYD